MKGTAFERDNVKMSCKVTNTEVRRRTCSGTDVILILEGAIGLSEIRALGREEVKSD